jgi:hypothetical protein
MTSRAAEILPRLAGALAVTLALAGHALAWGATGHRLIGQLAIEALPPEIPAFLRTPAVAQAVGELAREPDRGRNAGKAHDSDRDSAHFLDLGDDGRLFGGPALAALPATREEYDTALRAVGSDSWKAGWLPYAIVDDWQQLAKDFAYWRVDSAAAKGPNPTSADGPAHRAWFAADLVQRQALILSDLGALAHFVGDGSQPLHVSVHFNGWGDFPNPEGFTQSRIHAPFEGEFIHDFVAAPAVRADMTEYADCHCGVAQRTIAYLAATNRQVTAFYRLEKAGGFRGGDRRGRAFAAARVADGASQLRDMILDAWRTSATAQVGWPAVKVADVEAGKVDPWEALFGAD